VAATVIVALVFLLFTFSVRRLKDAPVDEVWAEIRAASAEACKQDKTMRGWLRKSVLDHNTLEESLAHVLSRKLSNAEFGAKEWDSLLLSVLQSGGDAPVEGRWPLSELLRADLKAVAERDPACEDAAHCLLHFKGFLGLQLHRVAHVLWHRGRKRAAFYCQSRCSELFGMDVHPNAVIGRGVMFDHATGVVVGETSVVGDDCSFLHGVTLGGTGKECGNRHPKLGNGVLIGAHASILGNIRVGDCAKIGCGSVVLQAIPKNATAVGVPAKIVGRSKEGASLADHALEHVSRSHVGDFRSIWLHLDQEQDGFLSPMQFHKRLEDSGLSKADIDQLFFQLDGDDDGLVSEKDFETGFLRFAESSRAISERATFERAVSERNISERAVSDRPFFSGATFGEVSSMSFASDAPSPLTPHGKTLSPSARWCVPDEDGDSSPGAPNYDTSPQLRRSRGATSARSSSTPPGSPLPPWTEDSTRRDSSRDSSRDIEGPPLRVIKSASRLLDYFGKQEELPK